MNKYKKVVFIWLLFLGLFFSFHFIVFTLYTSKVYTDVKKSYIGDLARTSYMTDLVFKRKTYETNLKTRHIESKEYNGQNIDLITIGDSFSNGMGYGLNRYYQDYIASIYNKKVLNIQKMKDTNNYIESILLLANSNYLKKIKVKFILIEIAQRAAIREFAKEIDFSKKEFQDIDFTNKIRNEKLIFNINPLKEKKISIINNINFNALKYNLKFMINGYGRINSVYREKLDRKFFSSKEGSDLLFYHDDINDLRYEKIKNIEKLNNNLNQLSKILEKQSIKLIFMPIVDKYNLYRPYIISNKYKESYFFEYLNKLNKNYIFVDTKKILSKELKKGRKDIFYSDDTHWSYKASKIIIENKVFNFLKEKNGFDE